MAAVRRSLSLAVGATLGGTAAGCAYVHVAYGPDTLPRLLRVYRDAIPAYCDYRLVQLKDDGKIPRFLEGILPIAEGGYEELHQKWAPIMLKAAFEMRGFFLKGGQLVASNYGNAFPRLWQKAFEPVLDQQPSLPYGDIVSIVEADLGHPIASVFSSFDQAPMAAASIGQVHRAVLRENGRHVVVKVMYPDVEAKFRGDIAITKAFYKVALPEQVGLLNEVEKQFANEFDYRRESTQLAKIRSNISAAGTFKNVICRRLFFLCVLSMFL